MRFHATTMRQWKGSLVNYYDALVEGSLVVIGSPGRSAPEACGVVCGVSWGSNREQRRNV